MSERPDVNRIQGFLAATGRDEDPTQKMEDLFGQLAVGRRLVTAEQLEECVREQERERAAGRSRLIGQILLQKGFLTAEGFQQVLSAQKRDLRVCATCMRLHDVTGHPGNAKLRCLNCGDELPSTSPREAAVVPRPPGGERGVPRQVGKYAVVREIARGGMGIVYEAQDPALKRRVALKTMSEKEFTSPEEVARMQREAAIAARLFHPNIVGVHEVGTVTDGNGQPLHFIAMDFVEGRTLARVLSEGKTPRADLVRMLAEVARAVAYAHGQGVVHRDLKPGNVLVADDDRVLLTDFGLARLQDVGTRLTQTQAVMGTPQYMAPEQVEGRTREIDFRTDVHGLGVMLYEVLTGQLPYRGATPNQLFQAILREEPVPPRKRDATIEKDLEVICLKAMAKERERRYPNAEAVAEELARFLAGEAVQARGPSQVYRVGKRLSQRKALFAAVGGASVLAAGVVGWIVAERARHGMFESNRAAAERAFAAGEWATARDRAGQALAIENDAGLQKIAEDARMALERERNAAAGMRDQEADHERRLAEADAYRKLRERVRPVEELVNELRSAVYVPGADLTPRLEQLERELAALETAAREAGAGEEPEVLRALGLGWYAVGDPIRAEELLRRAETRLPEDGLLNFTLGRIYLERSQAMMLQLGCAGLEGEKRRAEEWVDLALQRLKRRSVGWAGAQPIDLEAAEAYGALAEGKSEEVMGRCEDSLRRFGTAPGTEEFWNLLGRTRTGAARIEAYGRAIERRPFYPWAYFMRGLARLEQGELETAIADFDAALRMNQRLSEAYLGRAQAWSQKGDRERAIGNYSWALRFNPQCPFALYGRAQERTAAGEDAQAIADLEAVTKIAPGYAEAYDERGRLRAKGGDIAGAVQDWTRALEVASARWSRRAEVEKRIAEAGGEGKPKRE